MRLSPRRGASVDLGSHVAVSVVIQEASDLDDVTGHQARHAPSG